MLDRNPCGSSSGSAVAVAARLAPLAVGTETDGSIVCPAAANGVVGIKPTIGTVSQRGIVPIAHSQDTAGPLARTVADAALLLSVLASPAGSNAAPAGEGVAGLRVGVVRDFDGSGKDAAVEESFAQALDWLRAAGVVLVDPVRGRTAAGERRSRVHDLLAEFRGEIDSYLGGVERRRAIARRAHRFQLRSSGGGHAVFPAGDLARGSRRRGHRRRKLLGRAACRRGCARHAWRRYSPTAVSTR